MGMAASQARFLSLTARKTNVEWEGQQVNQQRTALSNESANLFNELNKLEVPTPPSVKDYTKVVYTFSTNALDNNTEDKGSPDYTITNIYSGAGGQYATVQHSVPYWQSAVNPLYSGSIVEDPETHTYSINLDTISPATNVKEYTYEPTGLQFDLTISNVKSEFEIEGCAGKFKLNENGSQLQWLNLDSDVVDSYDVVKLSNGKFRVTVKEKTKTAGADDDKSEIDKYNETVNNGATAYVEFAGNYYSVQRTDYSPATTDDDGNTQNEYAGTGKFVIVRDDGGSDFLVKNGSNTGMYTNGGGVSTFDPSNFDDGFYNYSSGTTTNYYQPVLSYNILEGDTTKTYYVSAGCFNKGYASGSYYLEQHTRTATKDYPCRYTKNSAGRIDQIEITDDYGKTFSTSLGVETVEDEAAYDQAMLDYKYAKDKYEKNVRDINSKTESIQQQDKTLELRLKQLDTEQNALKTEMDAVSKVIENNIESTFKTFA